MERDEWYESDKFKTLRLLNHRVHEINQVVQEIYDLLQLVVSQNGPEITANDKFTILSQQLRIVQLEASNLVNATTRLDSVITPRKFDDESVSDSKV